MKKAGFYDELGADHFLDNIDAALEYAENNK